MFRLPSWPALFGLTLGLLLAVKSGSGETPFNAATVQCYPVAASASAAAVSGTTAAPAQDVLAEHTRAVSATLEQTGATLARCNGKTCDAADAAASTRDLAAYLRQRQDLTTALWRELGEQGLELAARLYSDPRADTIHRHTAALIAQRTIDVAALEHQREALALALFKTASDFHPCAAIRRPVYRGYIY